MFEHDFFVQYDDIDENNCLSDNGFFKILQEIGCLHAGVCGYGLNEVCSTHVAWIVLDWKLKIFKKPSWNAKLHVKTWPSAIDYVCCFRDFEITNELRRKSCYCYF